MVNGSNGSKDGILDALVVGAGFAGLYLIHKLRGMGLSVRAVEAGSGVGGTWFWNRYPGARCDVESMQYSYSFDDDLQQEWKWSERFAPQAEILTYLNHVADRFDLRRDIEFDTRIASAHFDDQTALWTTTAETGRRYVSRFCIMATGCLSAGRTPDLPGLGSFAGRTFHTGNWPHEPLDFSGRRVGVVGTGSSAIQAIPVLAGMAGQLTVFQRTPNFSVPARNSPMTKDYERSWKSDYPALRKRAREEFPNGTIRPLGQLAAVDVNEPKRSEIYEAAWQRGGPDFMWAFSDLGSNLASNESAAEFVRAKIDQLVDDPEIAAKLKPQGYPIGTKRICVDSNYFETFNRSNVTLVDLQQAPIERIEERGLRTSAAFHELDDLVFATGFDAMTGALSRIDIRGRDNRALAEKWSAGPRTYLGLMSEGFPNLFLITGPGSPSVLGNVVVSIEQHVNWIADLLTHMDRADVVSVEADESAETAWVQRVNDAAAGTLYPRAASWYMGANIPGKPRVFMPYVGGVHRYREICRDIAEQGYPGFVFDGANGDQDLPSGEAVARASAASTAGFD